MYKFGKEEKEAIKYTAGTEFKEKMVDLKQFKIGKRFKNRMFSTCPSIPLFHHSLREPVEEKKLPELELSKVKPFEIGI